MLLPFSIGPFHSRPAQEEDTESIINLVKQLYAEDQKIDIEEEHIKRSLKELANFPEKGCFVVVENKNNIVGYTILINFWSNEYGGNILTIDEIFLLPEYRGKGLGTQVLTSIIKQRPYGAVALQLETTPDNSRAKNLYTKLGFKPYENQVLLYEYEN